jgi:hypothetical protein
MLQQLTAKSPEELNQILKELTERVLPLFGDKLKKIVLFGSYARGDYDDFYILQPKEVQEQIANAELFIKTVEFYLDKAWNELLK